MRNVVVVSAVRTPIGSFQGALAAKKAPELGAAAIREALVRARLGPSEVSEVIMGCVLPAGLGQAPARQAALGAGLSRDVPCQTINKVCGSGLKAVMLGAQAIALGDAEVVVCGGMESMSNVPYYLPQARSGYRMGHGQLVDGMIHDGLWDPYNDFHMGMAAELCARERGIDREAQDAYAAESFRRAQDAVARGLFSREIVPIEVAQRKGPPLSVNTDEQPGRGDIARLPSLRPAFKQDGTVTAGNASSINDGAAALVLMSEAEAARRELSPLGRILAYAQHAQAPEWFTTAPAPAVEKAVQRAGLSIKDIDLFEINEAFAVVAIANNQLLGLSHDRVNVRGGAIALGHPIGASGARILTTLLYAMADLGARRGVAALCIGGGEAVAVVVER
ncbi:MAG: acetyl-CoA C-acyltransferase [Myxococcales bacterium]|nr:acetyl-CoA C-acyltransferase [Myxococcota bacterium]MDW8281152.1 acetyl-CoA C-acyltransferase [Myxococcales bacterium]